jgi:hypothetical protein
MPPAGLILYLISAGTRLHKRKLTTKLENSNIATIYEASEAN